MDIIDYDIPAAERFNLDLLRAVIAKMEARPELVYMHCIVEPRECGTVGCIAGHAALLAHPKAKLVDDASWTLQLPGQRPRLAYHLAQDALGLTAKEADQLFFGYGGTDCITTPEGTPEHAAAAVAYVKGWVKERTGVEL